MPCVMVPSKVLEEYGTSGGLVVQSEGGAGQVPEMDDQEPSVQVVVKVSELWSQL